MNEVTDYSNLLNRSVKNTFYDALKASWHEPAQALFVLRTIWEQRRAVARRRKYQAQGEEIPPFMIASITKQCNLRCHGCYAMAQPKCGGTEFTIDEWRRVFEEARGLGIGIILLAGGEPLTRMEILETAMGIPEVIFPVFTNGTLIEQQFLRKIKAARNLIPILSLEGLAENTDQRRGAGVYQNLQTVMTELQAERIFYGVSVTVTRENFATVTSDDFITKLRQKGCKLFIFVEYVPVSPATEDLVLTEQERAKLLGYLHQWRQNYPGIFIGFPGDEEAFGGCLASGRGFVHLNANGGLEPCPFAPYSDLSLKDYSLREALRSKFLAILRENHQLLSEHGNGGCALWEKRDLVQELLHQSTTLNQK